MRKLHLYGQRRNDVITDLQKHLQKITISITAIRSVCTSRCMEVVLTTRKKPMLSCNCSHGEELEALELSYCFMEGTLPTDEQMKTALNAANKPLHYTKADFSEDKKDYLTKLVGRRRQPCSRP